MKAREMIKKNVTGYFLLHLFAFTFYFLAVTRRDSLYHCKQRNLDVVLKSSGAKNCDSRLPQLQQITLPSPMQNR